MAGVEKKKARTYKLCRFGRIREMWSVGMEDSGLQGAGRCIRNAERCGGERGKGCDGSTVCCVSCGFVSQSFRGCRRANDRGS